MVHDNRKPLPSGYSILIIEENIIKEKRIVNHHSVTVCEEIGRGGSCIVYWGMLNNKVGQVRADKKVIIKEFYPKRLENSIVRKNNMMMFIENAEDQIRFEKELLIFCEGQAKQIIFANDNSDKSLPTVSYSGKALGTFYAVSDFGHGETLSKIDMSKKTMIDSLRITASICDAIFTVHKGKAYQLYLDCKPANIFINGLHAYLFDFNTVQYKDKIRYCSYSEGWSAPEQEFNSEGTGYADIKLIGYHTDIYSISAVLFWLLTGICPSKEDFERLTEEYDWQKHLIPEDSTRAIEDSQFILELDRIMKKSLELDPNKRKEEYSGSDSALKLKHEIEHLIALAETVPYKSGFEETNSHLEKVKEDIIDALNNKKESNEDNAVDRQEIATSTAPERFVLHGVFTNAKECQSDSNDEYNIDDELNSKFNELFYASKESEPESQILKRISEKKGQNFINMMKSRIGEIKETTDENASSLIPLDYQVNTSTEKGKHFTLPDVPGYKTIVFEVYKSIDYNTLSRYYSCEPVDTEQINLPDGSGTETVYYIHDIQENGNKIIVLHFNNENHEAYINNGLLMNDNLYLSKRPLPTTLGEVRFDKKLQLSASTYNIENLKPEDIAEIEASNSSSEEIWCEADASGASTVIIDPETAQVVKRELYYDETSKEWKARIRIVPYKSYFAFQLSNSETNSLFAKLSYIDIAKCYKEGKCGFPKDFVKAAEYFEKDGTAFSMYEIAALFRTDNTLFDEEIYYEYLNTAIEMGCEEAQIELILNKLFSAVIDREECERLLSLKDKTDFAEFIIGYFAEKGVLDGGIERAWKSYQDSAERGFKPACTRIGMMGTLEKNNLSNTDADYCMGCFLFFGLGIIPIKSKGIELLINSATKGNPSSIEALFCIYEVDPEYSDKSESLKWMKELVKFRPSYINDLANRLLDGEGCEVNDENDRIAFDLLQRGAKNGNKTSQHNLAWMYKTGRGCERDYERALYLFKEAGRTNSFAHLGEMYEKGLGVLADFVTAIEYYKKAADLGSEKAKKRLKELDLC